MYWDEFSSEYYEQKGYPYCRSLPNNFNLYQLHVWVVWPYLGYYSDLENHVKVSWNLWVGNMTLTCSYTSKLLLECILRKNNNRTQCSTIFQWCQFLKAFHINCLQSICATETVSFHCIDTNSQYKYTCIIYNKQKLPIPFILATSCSHRTWEVQGNRCCCFLIFFSFVVVSKRKILKHKLFQLFL